VDLEDRAQVVPVVEEDELGPAGAWGQPARYGRTLADEGLDEIGGVLDSVLLPSPVGLGVDALF
jgi:hypothetical protein